MVSIHIKANNTFLIQQNVLYSIGDNKLAMILFSRGRCMVFILSRN